MSDKESHVTKCYLTIWGEVNRTWRFTPQIAKYDLPPLKSSNFEQNFKRTQHHALLHKGLFCERPKMSLLMENFNSGGKGLI